MRPTPPVLALLLLCSLAACTGGSAGSSVSAVPPITGSAAPGDGRWTTYHHDSDRDGVLAGGPSLARARVTWRSAQLDGLVYAEPLAIGDRVITATEANSVYALDAATGGVAWRTNLGAPVDASTLPCGNITPTSGVTATPVADPATGTLYVAAFLAPAIHELFALRLDTGQVLWHRSIDPPEMDPRTQQLRSALALANGRVYAAYGGLFGDCGTYHGWLAAAAADGSGRLLEYRVPTENRGGIWAPSGPAIDADGNVYATTGNSSGAAFDDGNTVLKLSADLRPLDSFTPSNWPDLNDGDLDLGSVGPAVLPGDRVFQIGKGGVGYLLDGSALGGIGGELFQQRVCDAAFVGTAHTDSTVYVPCTDGVISLQLADDRNSFTLAWRSSEQGPGAPVVAGGLVWTAITEGAVLGLDPATGRQRVRVDVGEVSHFPSLGAAPGCLFVPTMRTITAVCAR